MALLAGGGAPKKNRFKDSPVNGLRPSPGTRREIFNFHAATRCARSWIQGIPKGARRRAAPEVQPGREATAACELKFTGGTGEIEIPCPLGPRRRRPPPAGGLKQAEAKEGRQVSLRSLTAF